MEYESLGPVFNDDGTPSDVTLAMFGFTRDAIEQRCPDCGAVLGDPGCARTIEPPPSIESWMLPRRDNWERARWSDALMGGQVDRTERFLLHSIGVPITEDVSLLATRENLQDTVTQLRLIRIRAQREG